MYTLYVCLCVVERSLEDDELVYTVYRSWSSAEDNRFNFVKDVRKYELFQKSTVRTKKRLSPVLHNKFIMMSLLVFPQFLPCSLTTKSLIILLSLVIVPLFSRFFVEVALKGNECIVFAAPTTRSHARSHSVKLAEKLAKNATKITA